MNLLRIQYFVVAAECSSFTKAAKRLYTSQPNLSKQISVMENELGLRLFYRSGRMVTLTRAGTFLYERLKDLPDRLAADFEQAKALSRRDSGRLKIGILEGQDVNIILADRFQRLENKGRGWTFELERNSFSNLRQGLIDYRYDLILTLSFELEEMHGVRCKTLIQQNGAIAVSRKNELAMREDLTLGDFRDEEFVSISPDESKGGYDMLIEQCALFGFVPRIVRLTNSLESLLLCVETGLGVAMLDRNTRMEKNSDVRIIPIPSSRNADVVAVWLEENQSQAVLEIAEGLKC